MSKKSAQRLSGKTETSTLLAEQDGATGGPAPERLRRCSRPWYSYVRVRYVKQPRYR